MTIIILPTLIIAITTILAFSAIDQSAYAASFVISDDARGGDCELSSFNGVWDDVTNTCTVIEYVSISFHDSLIVDENVTVVFQGGAGGSSGVLNNFEATITNRGTMKFVGGAGEDSGVLNVSSDTDYGDGNLTNNGSMKFVGGAGKGSGILNNDDGTVNNSCEGTITGTVTGDPIIQESPCISDPTFCGKPITAYDSVIEGTDNDDLLLGTSNDDLIFGNNDNDLIFASDGDDCVFGGNGDDSIFGRGGNDILSGENGDDTIFGAMGNDILSGGAGNDHLMDDFGNDSLDGGDEIDMCYDKYGNNEFKQCEIKNEQ